MLIDGKVISGFYYPPTLMKFKDGSFPEPGDTITVTQESLSALPDLRRQAQTNSGAKQSVVTRPLAKDEYGWEGIYVAPQSMALLGDRPHIWYDRAAAEYTAKPIGGEVSHVDEW